ncbi:MAG TPA: T9SS type A sorting domain-containing protein [Bacteroidia bacterium]|nr:T9SS type A sorting domain-containing protein [Bacteroidia bacterium]
MKKILLLASIITFSNLMAQSTATNFTANDCAGTSHTLFNELDAGKVIVISFVMPCASCIGPTKTAYTEVQSFSSSYPGRVFLYIADDYANDPCSTIDSWATANAMPNSTRFSSTSVKMTDYGSAGMPKVVVLGGSNHTVFYNANNTVSGTAINTAITLALNTTSSIFENNDPIAYRKIFPNPAKNNTNISFYLKSTSDIQVDIYNAVGMHVKTIFSGKETAGVHNYDTDCSELNNGLYFVKINSGDDRKTMMLSVAH